ncbi:MAG: fumarylacetoacetate hydrolase family protein [Flammeovirgaceae bacterium]|nr:fumarylacetoacetate hydrolase family protein [Flammeovirgaceae bacterium]MDW8288459.1 fumarylacetoacetate hydrolase family protein [Flammeovirgaceae bacterium]
MKILCVGRNYAEHVAELKNETPEEPVIFAKPDTALLKDNAPFYIPSFTQEVHHEVEILLKISKDGKHIAPEFAHKYFDQIGLGIDFTARDLQNKLKAKGLPWELAKAFDSSAVISPFIDKKQFADIHRLEFSLKVNDEVRQRGNTAQMIYSFEHIIAFVSKFFTLRKGDIIFTGTPKGVAAVKQGDLLEGFIQDQKMFSFYVK